MRACVSMCVRTPERGTLYAPQCHRLGPRAYLEVEAPPVGELELEDVELLEEEHDAEDGEVLLVLAKAVEELDLLLDGLLRDLRERGAVLGLLDGLGEALLALLLGVARRIHTGHLSMHHGGWSQQWGHDVHGKTLGIVGCGRIGTAVARRAAGFNMRLLAYDPFPNEAAQELGVEFVSLETLLQQSDYVSLHAAVTPETEGLISAPQLHLMKPNSYLINPGRGALVSETDLAACLNAHGIAGAAVDTYLSLIHI